jgi:hypothetical protein
LTFPFKALAYGDLETLGGERGTQCARHSFGVAEVAHISILCSNEIGAPGLALLTRRSGAKACERLKGCDTFTIPEGLQAAGRIYPHEGCPVEGSVSTTRHMTIAGPSRSLADRPGLGSLYL